MITLSGNYIPEGVELAWIKHYLLDPDARFDKELGITHTNQEVSK